MVYPFLLDLNDPTTGVVNFTSDFVPINFAYNNKIYCYNLNGWNYVSNPTATPYYGSNSNTNYYGITCN